MLYFLPLLQTLLRCQILEQLLSKMEYVLNHPDMNIDYLQFKCNHELILIESVAEHVDLPLPDEELDNLVVAIKAEMPNVGDRLVMGRLRSLGHRIQWSRVKAAMHGVDETGSLSRLTQLGCVVRRTYCVRAPLSLVHVDTNHKLIR
ncbi:hypothetical protein CHARACLAT_030719 [Characodon lateralis]|uniref:Uncharacterized protein n=1 Tax=Characodon lateralis TaxID=208331 RepID=A0ABU7F7D4_9TELE|nr:hypothetical protein [Characodon lateralis]